MRSAFSLCFFGVDTSVLSSPNTAQNNNKHDEHGQSIEVLTLLHRGKNDPLENKEISIE